MEEHRATAAIALVGDASPDSPHRREIEVTILEPGWSKFCLLGGKSARLYHDEALLKFAAHQFDSVPAFLNHVAAGDWMRGSRDVRDLVGVYHDPHYVVGEGLKARLRFLAAADKVYQMCCEVIEAREMGDPVPDVGLSADMNIKHGPGPDDRSRIVKEIASVASVDVVVGPSAGGSFDRIIQQAIAESERRVARMAKKKNPDQDPEGGQAPNVDPGPGRSSDPSDSGVLPAAPDHPDGAGVGEPTAPVVAGRSLSQAVGVGVGGIATPAAATWEPAQVQLAATQAMNSLMEIRLAASGLPDPAQDQVRRVMLSRLPWTPEDLDAEIEAMKGMLGKLAEPGVVKGMGAGRIAVGLDPMARFQLATDKMLGAEVPDSASDIPRLSGIREWYHLATGDYDFSGLIDPERAQLATTATQTSDVTSVLKNTLSKLMLKAYDVRPKWWEPVVTWADWETLNTVTLVRGNDFGDLDSVSEAAAYQSKTWGDVEETSSFTKYGNYVGITLEMIANDDMAHIRTIPRRLANAAWKTLSTKVSEVFTSNSGVGPTMADTKALFHADHGNLGTTALAAAEFGVAAVAMFEQADAGSDAIGLNPKFLLVPIELRATALTIMESTNLPGTGDNDINPYRHWCEVIVVPDWTDANNWCLMADPAECEGIVLSSWRGNRTPELFVADESTVGSMFTNDEMKIKVRFFINVGVADHRPFYKENVA